MKQTNVDQHLNEVTVKQFTWKPSVMRNVAVVIVWAGLTHPELWPDEVKITCADADKNCIGTSWKLLYQAGIIEPTGSYRRSKAPNANGRKVFCYRLKSVALANKFLAANKVEPPQQPPQLKQTELI